MRQLRDNANCMLSKTMWRGSLADGSKSRHSARDTEEGGCGLTAKESRC